MCIPSLSEVYKISMFKLGCLRLTLKNGKIISFQTLFHWDGFL